MNKHLAEATLAWHKLQEKLTKSSKLSQTFHLFSRTTMKEVLPAFREVLEKVEVPEGFLCLLMSDAAERPYFEFSGHYKDLHTPEAGKPLSGHGKLSFSIVEVGYADAIVEVRLDLFDKFKTIRIRQLPDVSEVVEMLSAMLVSVLNGDHSYAFNQLTAWGGK